MAKKKKIIIIVIVLLLVVTIVGMALLSALNRVPMYYVAETVDLQKTDLQNIVNITGTVESTDSKKIYSKLSYPVAEIAVEVGDKVSAGDILCLLDGSALENSIAQQNASINKTQQSANQQIANAQRELDTAKNALEDDLNQQLLSAKSQVASAEAGVKSAEGNVNAASVRMLNLRLEREDAPLFYDDAQAVDQYDASTRSARVDYDNAKVALEGAKESLESAKKNLEAVEAAAKKQLEDYEAGIASAQISANVSDQVIAVQKLRADLDDCTIIAPVDGVVTGVYVVEGAVASGLMFVIEDIESLKISTKIKEYDMADLKIGNAVEISADATGDAVFGGMLSNIAPTSVKDQAGETISGTDVEFEAEVEVTSKNTGLKIGMKTRMDVIYQEKKQVFSVPYDAVTENENGEEIIYIAKEDEEGNFFAEAVVVTTGMENDFSIEIISKDIEAGAKVITNIDGLIPGMQVVLGDGEILNAAPIMQHGGITVGRVG